jgi:hypothetical protein
VDDDQVVSFSAFLGLTLVAAYAPALWYIPGLPGSGFVVWKLLFAPVLLVLLVLGAGGPLEGWIVFLALLALLVLASARGHRTRMAWFVVPAVLGGYSLLQGLLAASLIRGLDAIGRM